MTDPDHPQTADWLTDESEQGLHRYLQTIRERWKLIALTVFVTTLFAILYVALIPKTYEATATLLVTPVSGSDQSTANLGLIRDSNDPTRDVETAAQLATSRDVALRAKRELGTTETPRELSKQVQASPIANSNIVAVTAKADTATEAQRVANAFAAAFVADRTAKLRKRLDGLIPALRKQVAARGSALASGDPLRAQLSSLETLRAGRDPTVRVETAADRPTRASWPRPGLSILAGIIAGFVLGVGGAFAAQILDPRFRREEQLRRRFRLPVLARIPRIRNLRGGVLQPRQLSPAGVEAFRTLRATISAALGSGLGARSVLVSGASPVEGKTSTALNLATSFALAGKEVILIEADIRRPTIGSALRVQVDRGIASVLVDGAPLRDTLIDAPGQAGLRLLLVDRGGEWMADQFSLPAAKGLVSEAKTLADVVIIDSPPLTEVIDALPLVQMADGVLLVARMGKTRLDRLTRLGELLAQQGIKPLGFAVVGVTDNTTYGYYGAIGQDELEPVRSGRQRGRASATSS